MFASRTNWERRLNILTEALERERGRGTPLVDLTSSNPADASLTYPDLEICAALSSSDAVSYHPDPKGLPSAREAISRYYQPKRCDVDPEHLIITASTSESYSLLFRLLCNVGENVLVPRPSYPLFDYLAQINDVALAHYELIYDHGWHIDLASIQRNISASTRAIIIVNPHNPAGAFLKIDEHSTLLGIARSRNLALIVDEVFIDYPFGEDPARVTTTASRSDVLTFTLNGISKSLALPQLKLGWIAVSGAPDVQLEALERLEILNDTYLSSSAPVQSALPRLFELGRPVREQILRRAIENDHALRSLFQNTSSSVLHADGGWYGIIRVPRTKSEEAWALELIDKVNVCVQPGYFFDFMDEGFLVVSLLTPQKTFREGINLMKSVLGT